MTDTQNPRDHAWDMMEKTHTCLLITHDGEAIRARPMSATVSRDENAIYFFTAKGSGKEEEIEEVQSVSVSFQNGNDFVVVAGDARLTNDRAKIAELFTPFAKAWFDGPDDPRIRLITVTPYEAEFWDTPGTVATAASMLTAAVTGGRPKVGENRKTAM